MASVMVLIIGLAACSAGNASLTRKGTRDPGASTSQIQTEALKPLSPGDPQASAAAVAAAQKSADKTDTGAKCQDRRLIVQGQGAPGDAVFIASEAADHTQWGPDCVGLVAGASCDAPFSGSYSSPEDTVYIDLQAWAPEAREPFARRLVGPFPGYGEFKNILLPFKVPQVSSIMLRAVMIDRNQAQLATGSEWIFQVDCHGKATP